MQQSYYPGDQPAEALTVTPLLDLELYTAATGEAIRPDGTSAGAVVATIDIDALDLDLSGITFDQPGVWQVKVTVTNGDLQRRLAPVHIVVQDETSGWHTLDSARASDWPDALDLSDLALHRLLEGAKHDVLAFAPELGVDEAGVPVPPPLNYQAAQLMQARNRHNAGLANPGSGDGGLDGFMLTTRPLDWQVKQLLRPTRGVPAHA